MREVRSPVDRRRVVRQGVLTGRAGRPAAGALLAAAAAAAAYSGALGNPFVYDDVSTVVANPSLRDLSNVRYILGFSLFRPLVNLSYAFDYAIWGLNPFGYHLTNLVLHAVAIFLLHRVVWRLVEDRNRVSGMQLPVSAIAGATALLWAVHPLLTEAVAYVSGRSEVMASVGVLAALLLFRAAVRSHRRAVLAGGAAAFLFGLGSKETAAVLPFVFLLWDWLLLRAFQPHFRRRLLTMHAPLVGLVAAAGAVRLWTLFSAEAAPLRGPWDNLLLQARVIPRYAALVFAPADQTIMHGVPHPAGPADGLSLLLLGMLVGLVVLAWRARRAEPLLPFGLIFFLLLLAPSSSLIALREPMAEHRAYLASAGLILIAVAAAVRLLRQRRLVVAAAAAAAVLLCALTVARTRVWADPVALWSESASRWPDMWEPHYQIGDALRERGGCAEAVEAYRQVVRLRPQHRDAHNNLGICLAELGRYAEANDAFRAALRVDPAFARAYANLGNVALMTGETEAARTLFLEAIERDARIVTARRQLVALSEAQGEHATAVRYCHELAGIIGMVPELVACIERNEARARGER
jgi:Flp pilus assembly protein TadD